MTIDFSHEELIFLKNALLHYGLVRENKEMANRILAKLNESAKLG